MRCRGKEDEGLRGRRPSLVGISTHLRLFLNRLNREWDNCSLKRYSKLTV